MTLSIKPLGREAGYSARRFMKVDFQLKVQRKIILPTKIAKLVFCSLSKYKRLFFFFKTKAKPEKKR